ncbi:hypothetical protein PFMG_04708, partial [Plasmodium falciparum IGH-CR14]
ICCALQYLHSNNIIHRDIKAENFLFKNKNTKNIKLIDFGMAKRVNCEYLTELCGSPHYISPELIRLFYNYTCINNTHIHTYIYINILYIFSFKDEILNKNINWKGKEFSSLSIEAVDFLKRLLERNEKKRLTAYQALHHPWITSQVG